MFILYWVNTIGACGFDAYDWSVAELWRKDVEGNFEILNIKGSEKALLNSSKFQFISKKIVLK